jgi:hypothetical protein
MVAQRLKPTTKETTQLSQAVAIGRPMAFNPQRPYEQVRDRSGWHWSWLWGVTYDRIPVGLFIAIIGILVVNV